MKKFTLFFVLLCLVVSSFAAPARRVPITYKQSDGTELYVTLTGDETFHYCVTLDGVPVVKGDNGDYCYATLSDEGILVSTGCIAHNAEARSFEESQIIDTNNFAGLNKTLASKARAARRTAPAKAATVATTGEVDVPVLLVEFSDVKFTFSKEAVSDLLNKENYEGYDNPIAKTVGSAKDYFIAQSDGKFKPNFIVTDILTLPNSMSYYGGNDSNGNDRRPGHMIADGLVAADANMDFSIFDNDGDGCVEFVYCVYAGYGENTTGNDENCIWPQQWELSATTGVKTHDNVKFNVFACSNELAISREFANMYGADYLSGIGTMCHEFSHCLGLPDLYDTSSNATGLSTFGYWDLMDIGSYVAEGYVPVGYSAYERDFMGWRSLEVLDEKGKYSMEALTGGGHGYKIVNPANSNEYYVLENRQQEGWDKFIFNAGMLISHIDYNATVWNNNTVNNQKSHLRLSLVPADNEIIEYDGENGAVANASYKGDVWPGTSGNTAFTDTSVPAATLFTGGTLGKPITNITHTDGVISFLFMWNLEAPVVLSATDITDRSFTANWEAVDGANEYTVELEKVVQLAEGEGDAVVLLNEDFVGCTKANEYITNLDDYTSVSGWTGSKLYGEQGVLRVGASASVGSVRTPKLNHSGSVIVSFSLSNYNSNDIGSVLTVSLVNTSGVAITSENFDATSDWENKEIVFDASGDFYIEFSTINSTDKKRVNLDDVVVEYRSSQTIVPVEKVTTTDILYTFTELDGGSVYRYRVSACDEYISSEFSEYETVTIFPTSISDVISDNDASSCEVYTADGIPVYSGSKDAVSALPAGVYIIKCGNIVKKIRL